MDGLPIMITDGDCGFCQRAARVLVSRARPVAHVAPYQSLDLAVLGVSAQRAQREVLWVDRDEVRGGARAIAAALLTSPARRWRAVGRVISMAPFSWLAAAAYVVVARNRHRLPGGTAECVVR